jgi:hypothetical protein
MKILLVSIRMIMGHKTPCPPKGGTQVEVYNFFEAFL